MAKMHIELSIPIAILGAQPFIVPFHFHVNVGVHLTPGCVLIGLAVFAMKHMRLIIISPFVESHVNSFIGHVMSFLLLMVTHFLPKEIFVKAMSGEKKY